jgi:hypothetical protein
VIRLRLQVSMSIPDPHILAILDPPRTGC